MKKKTAITLYQHSGIESQALEKAGSALVVVDAQEEYRTGRLPLHGIEPAIAAGVAAIHSARQAGIPVIHVLHQGSNGGLFDPDSRFFQPIAGLEPAEGEATVIKRLPNSFAGTELEQRLRQLGARQLVLVGFMTHVCIESTARAALDLGFDTRILVEATATRALPSPFGDAEVSAEALQEASLAALFDRFAFPITQEELSQAR